MVGGNSRGNAVGPAAGRGRGRVGRGGQSSRGGRGQGRRGDGTSRTNHGNASDDTRNESQGERQSDGIPDESQSGGVAKSVGTNGEASSQPTSQTASIPVTSAPPGGFPSSPVNVPPGSPENSATQHVRSSALPSPSPRGKVSSKANAQINRGGTSVEGTPGHRQGRGRDPSKSKRRTSSPGKRHREDQENCNSSRKKLKSNDRERRDIPSASERRAVDTSNTDISNLGEEMRSLFRRISYDNEQLIQTLRNENRLLKDDLKKVAASVDTLAFEVRKGKVGFVGKDRNEANATASTPKKLYEETMCDRLEGLEDVFSSTNMKAACWRVLIRFIMKNVVGNSIPPDQIAFVLNTLMYGLPREWKNSEMRTSEGNASSEIRRSIVTECVRLASNIESSNCPFWLKGFAPNEKESSYLNVRYMQEGFDRRERGRSVGDRSLKRRNAIGTGSAKPSKDDDSEFVGWWAYGRLNKFLNQGRKNANALVFENVFYLFARWLYTIDDRALDESEVRKVPGYSEKLVTEITDIMSKDSVSFEWEAAIGDEGSGELRIPYCVTSSKNRQTSERNRQIYTAFALAQQNLLCVVEHKVHVHKDVLSKGARQRKGGELKNFRRKLTLLDTASDFLIGLCYGDRNLFGWDFMRYNRNTLKALYALALCFRHVVEQQLRENNILTLRGIGPISNANAQSSLNGNGDVTSKLKKLYNDMLPNDQLQGRIISRCVWGVRSSDYNNDHIGDDVSRDARRGGGSPVQVGALWGLSEDEGESTNEDDDEDSEVVNAGRSARAIGSERQKNRSVGRYDEERERGAGRKRKSSRSERFEEEESDVEDGGFAGRYESYPSDDEEEYVDYDEGNENDSQEEEDDDIDTV